MKYPWDFKSNREEIEWLQQKYVELVDVVEDKDRQIEEAASLLIDHEAEIERLRGTVGPHEEAGLHRTIEALEAEVERLKADRVRLANEKYLLTREVERYADLLAAALERAGKAEAEVERLTAREQVLFRDLGWAQQEVERLQKGSDYNYRAWQEQKAEVERLKQQGISATSQQYITETDREVERLRAALRVWEKADPRNARAALANFDPGESMTEDELRAALAKEEK
jgi:chromosome segregation ATPase